jgi:hypothetical protein
MMQRVFRVEVGNLRDVDNLAGTGDGDAAVVGLFHAGHDFEEGGFAGTVGADKADAFAFLKFKRDALEDGAMPKGFFDIFNFGKGHVQKLKTQRSKCKTAELRRFAGNWVV